MMRTEERPVESLEQLDWRPCAVPGHFDPEWQSMHAGDAFYRIRKLHANCGALPAGAELDVCKRFVDAWQSRDFAYCSECLTPLTWRQVFEIIEVIGS